VSRFFPQGRATQTVSSIVPKGISLFSKLNAAQFSSLAKGTIIAKLKPASRGQINKAMNAISTNINKRLDSGGALILANKSISKKIKNKDNGNN
jgi:hypothetical protein